MKPSTYRRMEFDSLNANISVLGGMPEDNDWNLNQNSYSIIIFRRNELQKL